MVSLALLLTTSTAALAQSVPDIGSIGVREPARMDDEIFGSDGPGFAGAGGSVAFIIPGFIHLDGADLFGVTFGMVDRARLNGLPLQLRAGYRRMETDAAGFNQLVIDGKLQMKTFEFGSTIALNGKFQKTMDASTGMEAGGAVDHLVKRKGDRAFSVGASASYRLNKPDGGGAEQSGLAVGASASVAFNSTLVLEPSYEFNTDITGTDSYTVALVKAFPQVRLAPVAILVGGKGQLASFSLKLHP